MKSIPNDYDFGGWATRANVKCSDGRTIMPNAFKDNDGYKVPLVWNHQHNDPNEVIGYAILENRPEGVYTYGKFNDTETGRTAKQLVEHGDVDSLSIYANQLKQDNGDVHHGNIREVSLVLAGANPGAYIDAYMSHSEESEDEAIIYSGELISLTHSDDNDQSEEVIQHNDKEDDKMASEKTVADVFKEIEGKLSEDEMNVIYGIIGAALDGKSEGGEDMKHNAFDNEYVDNSEELMHAAMGEIIGDAKRCGSMKESFLAHADDYGIQDIEWLFPEDHNLNNTPEFIKRDTGWVSKVMGAVHHIPFSRIKSMFADIREDEARAKGYIKGNFKKEEVFSLLKRSTTPTTIYKKQKMDRDDVIDITDFDVISWLKTEMRMMLDEEIARAILVGDGRLASSDDKINESNIRPVWKDEDLFTVKTKVTVAAADDDEIRAKKTIKAIIKSRKEYKGSGNPTFFTTEDFVTDCLLIEDGIGHRLYNTVNDLATALRVKEIVTVEVMENLSRVDSDGATRDLVGLIVNLADYDVGADKGGAINMFDDFDIDYNQQKYLIETRCSGALVKPFSAIAVEMVEA